uniref:Uncharacterized protein n=1 Tax=Ciona intestinalis TaxID=7719 RepID=H2XL78_CIOIN
MLSIFSLLGNVRHITNIFNVFCFSGVYLVKCLKFLVFMHPWYQSNNSSKGQVQPPC